MRNVSNMLLAFSYQHAEFIAINQKPAHDIMSPQRFGNADGLSHEVLQPGPARQVCPCNLLRLCYANGTWFWMEVTIGHVCTIGRKTVNVPRCHQCFALYEDFILMCPHDLRSDDARLTIKGRPAPALVAVLPGKTPHLGTLRFIPWLDLTTDRARGPVWDGQIVNVLELRRLFLTLH